MRKEKGFVSVYIDGENKNVSVSGKPYATRYEAESALYIGGMIQRVAIVEIEYLTP